jgi:hypothetical protein
MIWIDLTITYTSVAAPANGSKRWSTMTYMIIPSSRSASYASYASYSSYASCTSADEVTSP